LNKAVLTWLVWGLAAIVLAAGIIRVVNSRDHRSADQKILIEKSKQRN